jgi:FkbM family methyltransferase
MSGFMDMLGRRGTGALGATERGTLLSLGDLMDGQPRHLVEAAVRARCQAVTLDQHTVLCRVLGRYKFLVDSRDIGLAPHLMLDGYWEFWATEFMLRRIRPGPGCLGCRRQSRLLRGADGGAGRARRAASWRSSPIRAWRSSARDARAQRLLAHAEVQRLAAGDRSGATLRFPTPRSPIPKNGRLMPMRAARAGSEQDNDTLEVAVKAMRLDDLGAGPVNFLKIDVEGAEEQVWAGMQGLLDRSPEIIVLMEFNALRCTAAQRTLTEIAARFPLRELGMDARVVPVGIADILPRREDTLLVLTHQRV